MKKLFLICFCLISFKTMFGLSVNVYSYDKTGPNCNNGSIYVDIHPDIITNAFKVRITGPGGYVNETCPVGSFQNFDVYAYNLAAGSYSVEVWRLGFLAPCSGPYDSYYSNNITINSPTQFTASISHTNATAPATYGCANGSLTINANSSINLIADVYLNNSYYGTYGVNGAPFTITNLPVGNYGVYLSSNCYNTILLTESISAMPCNTDFNPTVTASGYGCNNGTISFTVLNGVNVSYYDITVSSIPSGNLVQQHLGSTAINHTFNNLSPGSYWVTVYEHRQGSGCYCTSPSKVVVVGEDLPAPPPTVLTITPAASCNDGSVMMSNGDFFSSLAAGSNTVTGYYISGCVTIPYSIAVTIPTPPCNTDFNPVVQNSGYGCNNGSISFTVLNALPVPNAYVDITVSLYPSGNLYTTHLGSTALQHTFENLPPNTYWVTIFEHRGSQPCYCTSESKIVVVGEELPAAAPTVVSITAATSPTCSDGIATLTNGDVYYNLPAGSNTLSGIYHAGECIALNYTANAVIPATPCNQITVFQTVKNSSVNCGTGIIHLELSASANNLIKLFRNTIEVQNFNWTGSSYDFENLPGGNYEIQVYNLDQCSCMVSANAVLGTSACSLGGTLVNNGTCNATFTSYPENNCGATIIQVYRGNNNTFVESFTVGNVFNYLITKNGNYTLVMTDATGCTASTQFNVNTIACVAPTNLSFTPMTNNRVKLLWDTNSCAIGYAIQYRLVNSTTWTTFQMNVNRGDKVFQNIQPNMQYEWRIRTICSATSKSAYSSIQTFCIGPNCVARLITDNASEVSDLKIVPNPAADFIKLNFDSEEIQQGSVNIIDQVGKSVYFKNKVVIDNDFTIDISNLPAGLYILNFLNEKQNHVARFIKMN